MTASLRKPVIHAARDVDELLAAEWALEELVSTGAPSPAPAAPRAAPADPAVERAAERAAREAETESLLREAYLRGRQEGRAEGERAERAKLQSAVRAAEDALNQLTAAEERWSGALEENLCALAVAIARQVLGRELAADPGALLELVRRALSEFPMDQPVRIRVNPADWEMLTAPGWTTPGAPGVEGREVRWIADDRVLAGGCLVEGRERLVDGRVDTGLERIYRRISHAPV